MRFCKDYTTFNLGIQVDWGISKSEVLTTLNLGFWSIEFVYTKKVYFSTR